MKTNKFGAILVLVLAGSLAGTARADVKTDQAIAKAAVDARGSKAQEPVVLLSPACASYDQFANFVERGNTFRDLVMKLDGIETVASKTGKAA